MIHWKELNWRQIVDWDTPIYKENKKRPRQFYEMYCAFDIETSNIKDDLNIMYIWQMAFKAKNKQAIAVYGRSWEQWIEFMWKVRRFFWAADLKIFVHNLSYQFQYLRSLNIKLDNVFLLDARKPVKFDAFNGLMFCCSYIQTNMGLDAFTSKYGAKHQKLSGDEFDYNEKRYPDTQLTEEQLEYCENDVLGLVEALQILNQVNGDTIATMPLTNTGYVRRDVKQTASEEMKRIARDMTPSADLYTHLRQAFRGGNTHANRYVSGEIIDNVHSYDRASSYPAVQMCRPYPMAPFKAVPDPMPEDIAFNIKNGVPFVARIAMWNVDCGIENCCPYLATAKCRNVMHGAFDNGRILKADYLETTVTDIDMQIIRKTYKIEQISVISMYVSKYGDLPQTFKHVIMKYYNEKTKLKGIEGQQLYYMKSKNRLNSLYGMTATDPVRDVIEYKDDDYKFTIPDIGQTLEKGRKGAFLSYAWGVWCTAWARYQLQIGIDYVGLDFIYADTDSVKFTGTHDFGKLNKYYQDLADQFSAFSERDGKKYPLGVWQLDGVYDRFITLGAKKYAYEEHGKLHLTTAGVHKKKGAAQLSDHGGIEAFKTGFIFRNAGGTMSTYNDTIEYKKDVVQGHPVEVTSNIVISPSQYTLGITTEYLFLLQNTRSIRKVLRQIAMYQ